MKNKKSIIIGILVFLIIIAISIVLVVMLTKGVKNKEEEKVIKSSLYEVDHFDNTYVYVNTDGKIVTMEGYYKIKSLISGTSLAKKNEEDDYSVIDNKGNVIVESNKYESLDSAHSMIDSLTTNLNYIVRIKDKYALLNIQGKEITDFKYDNISTWMSNNYIYKVEVDGKYGVIANTRKSSIRTYL